MMQQKPTVGWFPLNNESRKLHQISAVQSGRRGRAKLSSVGAALEI